MQSAIDSEPLHLVMYQFVPMWPTSGETVVAHTRPFGQLIATDLDLRAKLGHGWGDKHPLIGLCLFN